MIMILTMIMMTKIQIINVIGIKELNVQWENDYFTSC